MGCPCETRTSTCRSFATISSGLYRFLAITVLLDVKDIPQVGPLQWGRISCRMAVTIYRGVMKLSPPTWRHHRLMIASTIVPIIQWQMSLIAGVDRSGKANLRRDVSLLRRTLRSLKTAAKRGRGRGRIQRGFLLRVSPDGLGIGRGSGLTTGECSGYSSLAQHRLRAATCPLSTLAAAN